MSIKTLSLIKQECEGIENAGARATHIVDVLYPKYIKCNYDPVESTNNRMLLHSNRHNQDELAAECNGFIFDYSTLKPLCYPPELPTLKWDAEFLTKEFSGYNIYKIYDGTVINLYWWNNSWTIGTGKGIDVGTLRWNGDGITFRKALDDVIAQYNIDMDSLSKSMCYSIGIAHPDMHPYATAIRAWFVCSYDFENSHREFDTTDLDIIKPEKLKLESWQALQ